MEGWGGRHCLGAGVAGSSPATSLLVSAAKEGAEAPSYSEPIPVADLLVQLATLTEGLREADSSVAAGQQAATAAAVQAADARRWDATIHVRNASLALEEAVEAVGGQAMAQLRLEADREALLEACGGAAEALAREVAALQAAEQSNSEPEYRRAMASVEGRLQLEQERHSQQMERLMFENDELRRATRVKSDKIALLRTQLAEARAGMRT